MFFDLFCVVMSVMGDGLVVLCVVPVAPYCFHCSHYGWYRSRHNMEYLKPQNWEITCLSTVMSRQSHKVTLTASHQFHIPINIFIHSFTSEWNSVMVYKIFVFIQNRVGRYNNHVWNKYYMYICNLWLQTQCHSYTYPRYIYLII